VDCSGAWSICAADCTKSFIVAVTASGGGASCEALAGDIMACLPGESTQDLCVAPPVSSNCRGTWATCSVACEKAAQRVWQQSSPPSESGEPCPSAMPCRAGEGDCTHPDRWIGPQADVDCVAGWAPCTEACEPAESRLWVQHVSQSGRGALCQISPPQDCAPGDEGCVEPWKLRRLWMTRQHWVGAAILALLALVCTSLALRKCVYARTHGAATATPHPGKPRLRRLSTEIGPGPRAGRGHGTAAADYHALRSLRSPGDVELQLQPEPEPEPEPELESESELDPDPEELALVVYQEERPQPGAETFQEDELSGPWFTEATSNLSISRQDRGLVRTLAPTGRLGRRAVGSSANGCAGVAVCRRGYGWPLGHAMASPASGRPSALGGGGKGGGSVYTAEFILERGDAAGAVVGVMHSEFSAASAGAKESFTSL
jgi:hypothetical protein